MARFYCKANGYPVPEILWRRSGEEIAKDNRFIIQYSEADNDSESTLIVVDVVPELAGKIQAEAVNGYGTATCEAEFRGMCMCVFGHLLLLTVIPILSFYGIFPRPIIAIVH